MILERSTAVIEIIIVISLARSWMVQANAANEYLTGISFTKLYQWRFLVKGHSGRASTAQKSEMRIYPLPR